MNRGRELWVGVVIIAAIAVGVVGTLWLKGTNWGRPTVPVEVLFSDVAQLSPGSGVKFRGVQIGRVSSIAVEPNGQAVRVLLELQREVEFPEDAVVLLAPESFFGDWQAEVVPRGRYPSFEFFDISQARRTEGVRLLGGYALPELSRLSASAEQISNNLAGLTERLEVAFNDSTATNLARAIDNLEDISRQVRDLVDQQAEVATSVTANADAALAEIEEASRVARRSFVRIEELLTDEQVDSILTSIHAATASIEQIVGDLSGSSEGLANTMTRADSTFARLDRLSARIEAGEGSLGRLVTDSTLAVRAADVLRELDLLLGDLRENPRRYVRLSIF